MGAILRIKRANVQGVDQMLDDEARKRERALGKKGPHELDDEKNVKIFNRVKTWFEQERERQADNRYQQSIDSDYYDQGQWKREEAEELMDRGQAPLVYNESAATIDWIIGTENRTRVDFKVFPRTDDDVMDADVKTKTLKYLNDVNMLQFHRSQAFADAVKVGLGWMEHGARTDTSQEVIFGRREDWRNMWHDSYGKTLTDEDWRYVHRVRWVDLDIAHAMFPDRPQQIDEAGTATGLFALDEETEDFWYIGKRFSGSQMDMGELTWRGYLSETGMVDNRRERVKLIETRYRMPTRCWYCKDGDFKGERFDHKNHDMVSQYRAGALGVYDMIEMRVWFSVRTEKGLLYNGPSPYKHNSFGFVPWWCYRRGRDGMPYGVMRRIRDPQDDLNKRASKTLFLLSTNRVIADHDAVEDHDDAREEVARPDAYVIKKKGSEFHIENNSEIALGHLQLMDRDIQMIRRAGGANDDNLGHQTNAESGEAIRARQLGGTIVTAQIFSNHRLSIQTEGAMRLSLSEQFLTEQRVIRVTGGRADGKPEMVRINQPVQDADGTVRYLNDMTKSQADFVVDEQDFSQSVRQAMFESMLDLIGKVAAINPEYALRLLRMALEFSDLPNKDEMAKEVKSMLGIVDPGDVEKMSPEELAGFRQAQADKQEAQGIQKAMAHLTVLEKSAQVKKLDADADKIEADAAKLMAEAKNLASGIDGAANAKHEQMLRETERRGADAIQAAHDQIRVLNEKIAARQHEIDTKAKTDKEIAQINADGRVEEARVTAASQAAEQALVNSMKEQAKGLEDQVKELGRKLTEKIEAARAESADRSKKDKDQADSPVLKAVTALVADGKAQAQGLAKVVVALEENTRARMTTKVVTAKTKGGKEVTMRIESAAKGAGK